MDKRTAAKIIDKLDQLASKIEKVASAGAMSRKVSARILHDIDSISDQLEASVFGREALRKRVAAVLRADSDEPYMKDHFVNTVAPRRTDPDEPYMHQVGPSYRSNAIDTFDIDRSSTVYNRDEYAVRDLSMDSTRKQPSWRGRGPVKDPSYR